MLPASNTLKTSRVWGHRARFAMAPPLFARDRLRTMRKRQSFHVLLDLNLDALLAVLEPMRDTGFVPCKLSVRQQRDAISLIADIDQMDDAPALALVGAILRLQHVRAATVETRCLAMDDDHA